MDAKTDVSAHVLEIPLASNGSAKWTIRAASVEALVAELAAADAAIGKIARLAGHIIAVTCGAPAGPREGQS